MILQFLFLFCYACAKIPIFSIGGLHITSSKNMINLMSPTRLYTVYLYQIRDRGMGVLAQNMQTAHAHEFKSTAQTHKRENARTRANVLTCTRTFTFALIHIHTRAHALMHRIDYSRLDLTMSAFLH